MSSAAFPNLNNMNPSSGGVLDQRLSLDVQGVDALRRTVRTSPQEGMKQASKQFEVMFMQMVLKSMREATPSDGMFSSSQEKMFTSMLDQQLTQKMSGRGLGLAEAMFAQLNRTMSNEATSPTGAVTADKLMGTQSPPTQQIAPAAPMVPEAGISLTRSPDLSIYAAGSAQAMLSKPAPQTESDSAMSMAQSPLLSVYETTTAQATLSRSILPQAHVEQFVSRMLPAAQRASQASGVPAQLIMAQAALESGWGRREILKDDGNTSYNLFGIKADKGWKGPVVEATTTEYVNGVAQKTRSTFRAYGSYDEAFSDHAKFLSTNPRYAGVLATRDPTEAAHGLQRAGYATDPQYGGKLIRIMKQMT